MNPALDSLQHAVDDGHNAGMSKMFKLDKAREKTRHLLDSIGKLPGKARQAAEPYRADLDSLLKNLDYADFAMTKWMNEYRYDSLKNDAEARIKYLAEEKLKVTKVKEAILGGLDRADSILKGY